MSKHRSLNIEVATRQCFGGMFERTSADEKLAQNIISGSLRMPPHPEWLLPASLTWNEDPFSQPNWRAQLHMLRWLEPLRRRGIDGDQDARDNWIAFTKSWVHHNPPGNSSDRFAWADMVEAIRGMCMVFGLPLVMDDNEWLLESIWEHGSWISHPSHIGKANHALHQHQALLVIGRLFDHDAWVKIATERILDLFAESYDEEGVNVEGSLGYHKNNYIWWRTALRRLEVEGIPAPEATNRLDLALTELAYATRPDCKLELIGDTETATLGPISSPEIDYVKSAGSLGTPPTDLAKIYKAGYIFGRSGWGEYERAFSDELFYSISFGFQNRIHGHCDGGSITVHSHGHPWLVDAGKFGYKKSAMRDYCLSRQGHNSVVIDNIEYDASTVVDVVSHSLSASLDEYVIRDTGYEGVELVRRVVYNRAGDFFIIVDSVSSSRGPVVAKQRWHLDDETKSVATKNGYQLTRENGSAQILWGASLPELSKASGQESPFDGWLSKKWMDQTPADVLQARLQGEKLQFVTVVAVSSDFHLKEIVSADETLQVITETKRNTFAVTITPRTTSSSMLGAGGTQGGSLAEIRANLQEMLTQNVIRPAEMIQPLRFTSQAWQEYKAWILTHPQPYEARLGLLDHFLDLLSSSQESEETGPDYGLRAAIIDVAGSDIGPRIGLTDASIQILREPLIQWPHAEGIVSRSYNRPVRTVSSPNEIKDCLDGSEITTAHAGPFILPFVTGRGNSRRLVIKFHGALNRMRTSLPMFQGLNSSRKSPDNYMIFQDPSLDLNRAMNLSWYLGDRENNLHLICAEYIREFQEQIGAEEIVLTGSSGGGFAALQIAIHLPNPKVLVFNPQTNIRSYFAPTAENALKTCFGQTGEDIDEKLSTRTSALSSYTAISRIPQILYVQNVGDVHHMTQHRGPFEAMLRQSHPDQLHRVRFVDEDWGPGHISPTVERVRHFETMLHLWQAEDELSHSK